jgi:predicted Zn-ribbon and HTH transcriptional regulator
MAAMMDPKHVVKGAMIELYDDETKTWIPLTIVSVSQSGNVECKMLDDAKILTTAAALVSGARLRPRDGSCKDCGYEAHEGPCEERRCSDCGSEVSSRCSQHPTSAVHVYRKMRYLADIIEEKPYPTRQSCEALRRDLIEQMQTLRNAEQPRQSRVMITVTQRMEIISALENATKLIESLPGERRRS